MSTLRTADQFMNRTYDERMAMFARRMLLSSLASCYPAAASVAGIVGRMQECDGLLSHGQALALYNGAYSALESLGVVDGNATSAWLASPNPLV